jgi:predicted lysophospholipase L1 biosynthesis ABC-type transport system permease subunit
VAERVFAVPFAFDLGAALITVVGGALATLGFGIVAAWAALAAKPAELLRHP